MKDIAHHKKKMQRKGFQAAVKEGYVFDDKKKRKRKKTEKAIVDELITEKEYTQHLKQPPIMRNKHKNHH